MTKAEALETAALHLRVAARKSQTPVTIDRAWDAIAEMGNLNGITLKATDVMRIARRELMRNEEGHLC